MGTRNLTMVYSNDNGDYKIAQYRQWNSYPEVLGFQLLKYLKGINIDELRRVVNNGTYLTKEDNSKYSWQEFYPEISRDIGEDILNLIILKNKAGFKNSIMFATDSLLYEWGYVIDLDKNKFEVYQGINKKQWSKNEQLDFLLKELEKEWSEEYTQYYPIKLIVSYELDSLPDVKNFLEKINKSYSFDKNE